MNTLFPLPPFPADSFNQSVVVRPAEYYSTPQGGQNPEPVPGYPYQANVQPAKARRVEQADGHFSIPRGVTAYEVRINYDPSDAVISALDVGDQIDWGNKTLNVLGPADNRGGWDVLWRINCEHVR